MVIRQDLIDRVIHLAFAHALECSGRRRHRVWLLERHPTIAIKLRVLQRWVAARVQLCLIEGHVVRQRLLEGQSLMIAIRCRAQVIILTATRVLRLALAIEASLVPPAVRLL